MSILRTTGCLEAHESNVFKYDNKAVKHDFSKCLAQGEGGGGRAFSEFLCHPNLVSRIFS